MTTTYSDGAIHTVSSSTADIVVTSATTLDVVSGAILGPDASGVITAWTAKPGTHGITASGSGTQINVSGGSVTGGARASTIITPGWGVVLGPGAGLTVTGGTIAAGNGQSGMGIYSSSAGAVNISGGTIEGASGMWWAPLASGGSLTISGGNFVNNGYLYGGGYGLLIGPWDQPGTAVITGGNFGAFPYGCLFVQAANVSATVTISGGSWAGPILLDLHNFAIVDFQGTSMNFIQGPPSAISGTLTDGTPISVEIVFLNDRATNVSASSTSITFIGRLDPP